MDREEVPVRDYISTFPNAERRFFTTGIAVRAAEDGAKIFRGYAAKFNSLSEDLGGFKERIAPGFFDKVLGHDVRVLKNHDPHYLLGRTLSGTAKIGVDETGLWYEYTDPGTSYSKDLSISIERKDLTQSSFAFNLDYSNNTADKWEKGTDGKWVRTLLEAAALYDVSPVTYPAYTDTSVASRGLKKVLIPEGISNAQDLLEMDRDLMLLDFKKS
jgi:uncharacterized protein